MNNLPASFWAALGSAIGIVVASPRDVHSWISAAGLVFAAFSRGNSPAVGK
jgi:hypothetical protein